MKLPAFAHEHGEDVSRNSGGVSSLTINISILSLIVVVIVIVLLHVRLNKQGSAISQMSGMMVTMTAAMMSSLVVGTIAGLMIVLHKCGYLPPLMVGSCLVTGNDCHQGY